MEAILLVIQLILALGLIGLVLMQKSDSDGFGLGGGSAGGSGMFSARGQANFLTRSTAILATLFILNSMALSIVAANMSDRGSLADRLEQVEKLDGVAEVAGEDEVLLEEGAMETEEQAPAVPKAE